MVPRMRMALHSVDPDRTGLVDRPTLRRVLREFRLGHLAEPDAFERVCAMFGDGPGGGGGGGGGAWGLRYEALLARAAEAEGEALFG